ncbi:class I SAM-dependent methyltransferase [Vibrio sp. S9_S30]|uniref:class I SAM-dependent methyltransferase n=1 Tax=Vibrio sp. S9_S30 TaxID=2720226 RepID=UPI0016811969|nr:class I SAM-dependent methyltransferase [Vibrio sp. S9_S30]MBD1556162.1 class I SAM-dependent methyltransferase [Vibrio sp. S9_S30]
MKDAKGFWDKSAPKYAKRPVRDEAVYQKKLEVTQGYFAQDWNILEFGCGTGTTAIRHSPYVNSIIAIDISSNMLEIAQSKAEQEGVSNIEFKEGTFDQLNLAEQSFDAVLGLNVLHLMDDIDSVLSQVFELLKPNGIFVQSTALIGQLNIAWRLLIRLMQTLNLAPYVNQLTKDSLTEKLLEAGFQIEYEWQPEGDSMFMIARKPAGEDAANIAAQPYTEKLAKGLSGDE